jgi:GlpG protein
MRMIGTIPTADAAERFSDYLLTQKIGNMVEESTPNGSWSVWVENDDDLDRGKSELSTFLANPTSGKYQTAARADKIRKQDEKAQQRRQRQFIDVRTSWGQPRQWAVPLTLLLIIVSCAVSLLTGSMGVGPMRHDILNKLFIIPEDRDAFLTWFAHHSAVWQQNEKIVYARYALSYLARGQVWRLFTSIFIHLSIMHLVFNMFWLRDLGGMIERQRSTWLLFWLVLISAIISEIVEFLWSAPTVSGGMSGVVYALAGYVWIKNRYEPQLGLRISNESGYIMIAWLFICMTGWVGPIANAAHVSGLIVGLIMGYIPVAFRRLRRIR